MDVSIIICTRNHSAYLRETLASLGCLSIPAEMQAELIVVDNASTDDTAAMAATFPMTLPVRVIHEARPGQSHARNAGLAASSGRILVFTDDDLRFPADWLSVLCRPIQDGVADGVAGAVVLAPHLERAWMEPVHRYWLAATEPDAPGKRHCMVGASMAFRRGVLDRVPGFDPALGPGALGFADDTLFSRQLWEAGFKIVLAESAAVEHHFEAARLTRASLLDAARKRGETKAYVAHHWEHRTVPLAAALMVYKRLQVALWHRRHPRKAQESEGLPTAVLYDLEAYHFYRHSLRSANSPVSIQNAGL